MSILLLPSLITQAKGNAAIEATERKTALTTVEVENLANRLNELRSVDKSSMTPSERKELRKETRYTAHQLTEPGAGGGILVSLIPLLVAVVLIILFI